MLGAFLLVDNARIQLAEHSNGIRSNKKSSSWNVITSMKKKTFDGHNIFYPAQSVAVF